ncbi:Phospholipase/carboxylesterase [Cordyceps fumosorosea ARSEF 2679]|uniref:Phospholipase/carboxylesterase n=1 Tax=Cordyceps fumosorosea (strain ARSEF 2679) TaxID=1081104 RepID=A0A167WKJ7_CORFA|nr:Phospholipase/carboxylesterase [Cordyceps fumosorosea ARSEF 2679]OAA63907.1 Phospholipase/carboxylesterase [Cordyceps fumosorosea ARSEF 2679]
MTNIKATTIQTTSAHTHAVVFLHGRGDDTDNFIRALDHSAGSRGLSLFGAFPSFRWVFPQAPTRRCASEPQQTWPQWFDVWDTRDFSAREELQAEGLREVVPEIRRILAEEAAALGGRWDRVILAGISMGAATGIHTLFNLDVPTAEARLGAFLGFSCRCPFAGRDLAGMRAALGDLADAPAHNKVLQGTPVLLEHCVDDPLVTVQNGRRLREIMTEFGARGEWREYPNGGHWFNAPTGMDDAIAFLNKVVQQTAHD